MVYGVMIEVFYWYCPLTYLEQYLQEKAGAESFEGGFIAHYLNEVIYINAPQWSLILAAVVGAGGERGALLLLVPAA